MLREKLRRLTPELALEAFIVSNLAFLAVDIGLAHMANRFARNEEWWPIVFSIAATISLTPGMFSASLRTRLRWLAIAVGVAAILVGVLGMIFHLKSAFFEAQTLVTLVYSAPFAAPLSYVGLGLLLLLTRMEQPGTEAWDGWVLFLALGGFIGNLALSILDHAQNAFFSRFEWLSVAAAAFGTSFLLMVLLRPGEAAIRKATAFVLAGTGVIGGLGFLLHVLANRHRPGALLDKAVYGAPIFAPLLFADLALLAALGLWARKRRHEEVARILK